MVLGLNGYGPALSGPSGRGMSPQPSIIPAPQIGHWFQAAAAAGGAPVEVRQATEAWVRSLHRGNGLSLSLGYQSLSASQQNALRNYFGPMVPALLDLCEESDARIFYSDLFHYARQNRRRNPALSGIILRDLAEGNSPISRPRSIQDRAQGELAAMRGEGPFGRQLEYFSDGFLEQVASPSLIAGLAAGSLVSSGIRMGMMSRFAGLPATRVLSSHTLAYLTAQGTAFAAEIPTIYLASHSVEALLNPNVSMTDFHNARSEMFSLAVMMGFLKVGGAAFRGVFNLGHGVHPLTGRVARAEAWTRWSHGATQQLGMMTGLYGYYGLGHHFGVQPEMNPTQALSHAFRTLIQFNAAGALAQGVLGGRYTGSLRQMETTTERFRWQMRWPDFSNWNLGPRPLTVSGGEIPIRVVETRDPLWGSHIMQMSGKRSPSSHPPSPGESSSGVRSGSSKQSSLGELLQDPQSTVRVLSGQSSRQLRSLLKRYRENGQLARLLLNYEGTQSEETLPFREAQERLTDLEVEFVDRVSSQRAKLSAEERSRHIENWINSLEREGERGLLGFMMHMSRLGIRGFDNLFNIRRQQIDFKARIMRNSRLRDLYYDLSLVSQFLNSKGINRWVGMDGSFLSNLITEGEGHCVSMSLLYAHFASLLGHSLELGVIPNHVYLKAKSGGAIETTANYSLLPNRVYEMGGNFPEGRNRRASDGVGFYMLHMGLRAIKGGRISAGREAFTLAEKILPESPSPHFHWGQYHQARFDFVEAARAFQRYAELSKENPGSLEKALVQLRMINDVSPDTLEVYDVMAVINRYLGRESEAEQLMTLRELLSMSDSD